MMAVPSKQQHARVLELRSSFWENKNTRRLLSSNGHPGGGCALIFRTGRRCPGSWRNLSIVIGDERLRSKAFQPRATSQLAHSIISSSAAL